jgi:hypothetical protein
MSKAIVRSILEKLYKPEVIGEFTLAELDILHTLLDPGHAVRHEILDEHCPICKRGT